MKTLVLAAGRSRRAKPIEDKNFLKFAGIPLIEHQLKALQSAGFEGLIIVAGAHNLSTLKGVASRYDATVVEQTDLDDGMAGAMLAARDHIQNEELFIVSSNDIVDASAYEAMLAVRGSDAAMLAYKVDTYFPGGYLQIENGQITSIIEKPGEGNEPSEYINLVLHYHKDPSLLFAALNSAQSENDDRYEVALDQLMKTQSVRAVPYDGYWQAIKFPWHVLNVMEHFFSKTEPNIDPSAQIAETAIIRGDVTIGPRTKVMDFAVIQGPAYIGADCIIANNSLVRGSMLGDSCIVGYSTEVARSFIGDDCWFHSNYIGDTVMGDNCSFGAGAICANLRLDEAEIMESGRNKLGPILGDNIRIGVQTSLMPGVRVGSGSFITSGVTLAQDIEPGKYVVGKTELIIKDNRANLDPSAREAMKKKLNG
jgi:NDP-sugar pyrophosphorylase family protein